MSRRLVSPARRASPLWLALIGALLLAGVLVTVLLATYEPGGGIVMS